MLIMVRVGLKVAVSRISETRSVAVGEDCARERLAQGCLIRQDLNWGHHRLSPLRSYPGLTSPGAWHPSGPWNFHLVVGSHCVLSSARTKDDLLGTSSALSSSGTG